MNDIEYLKSNGVDVDSGIEYLGDLESYEETMQEFLRLSNDKVEKLKEYKDADDLENYSIYSHSVKADARFLGFLKLSEVALAHETQAKAGNKEFIDANFDNFVSEIEKYKTISTNYLGDKVNAPKKEEEVVVPGSKSKAVLIVDDSEMIRDYLKKTLKDLYDCYEVENGQKAIDFLESADGEKISAVFLDLNMPEVNGFDVLEYYKEKDLFNKFPVSIISGSDDKESIDRAFKYPVIDMLTKPFTEDEVKRIAERTISYKE